MTERSDISGSSVGLSIYLIDSGTMVSVYTENSAEGTVFGLDFVTKHMVTEANGHQWGWTVTGVHQSVHELSVVFSVTLSDTHTHTRLTERVHHWLTHSPDLKESLTLKSCFYTLVCADSMSTQSPPGTLYMQILPCTETHKDYTNTTTTGGRGGRGVTTHSLAKNPQGEIWSLSNSEQIIKLVYEIHRGAGSDTHRQSFGSGGVLPPQL